MSRQLSCDNKRGICKHTLILELHYASNINVTPCKMDHPTPLCARLQSPEEQQRLEATFVVWLL